MDEKNAELTLYGEISDYSWWGDEVTPKQFKEDLDALGDIDTLNVYINSTGGDVFAGQTIYSILKRHKAKVNVYIDGLAASIASLIAMAGDKVIMPVNAMMMIHNPWTWAEGNANDFRKLADDLDKITQASINAYMSRVNITEDKLKELLDAETWLLPDEALEMGFATSIISETQSNKAAASARKALFDLFKNKNKPAKIISFNSDLTVTNLEEIKDIVKQALEEINASAKEPDKAPKPEPTPVENKTKKLFNSLFQRKEGR